MTIGFKVYNSKVHKTSSRVWECEVLVKSVIRTIKKPIVFTVEGTCLAEYNKKSDFLIRENLSIE